MVDGQLNGSGVLQRDSVRPIEEQVLIGCCDRVTETIASDHCLLRCAENSGICEL